ncbi:hypothetical protein EC973_001364 [Apophysomyces ossiformis]|uniref:Uncharacterized protein n=1 Tax=Apophysomyces ossiformis TaxID=679940 RepID=A0A8H7ES92_9FUNG|nr:hypothetical protein EC973_001364 [Apophysomyces ossiformis]
MDGPLAEKTQSLTGCYSHGETYPPSPPVSLSEVNAGSRPKRKLLHKSSAYIREKVFRRKPTTNSRQERSSEIVSSLGNSTFGNSSTTMTASTMPSKLPKCQSAQQQQQQQQPQPQPQRSPSAVKRPFPPNIKQSHRISLPAKTKPFRASDQECKDSPASMVDPTFRRRSILHVVFGLH